MLAVLSACSGQKKEASQTPSEPSEPAEHIPTLEELTLPDTVFSSVGAMSYVVEDVDSVPRPLQYYDDLYDRSDRVMTFRRNLLRNASFGGHVEGTPKEIEVAWSYDTPYGRAETKFAASVGSAVYEFGGAAGPIRECRVGGCSVALDYGPGVGRVFAVYPRRLAAVEVEGRGGCRVVTVRDASGAVAPGRQVVELEVRDAAGGLHDETGRYVVEGSREIPLRVADGEAPPSSAAPWRVSVRELTTGLVASEELR